jgi:hypothetical protein
MCPDCIVILASNVSHATIKRVSESILKFHKKAGTAADASCPALVNFT